MIRRDKLSGSTSLICAFPTELNAFIHPCFDSNNYIYLNLGELHMININSGKITSKALSGFADLAELKEIQFDNSTGILYILYKNSDSLFLGSIDLETGAISKLFEMPSKHVDNYRHYTTYDDENGIFFYESFMGKLYGIDVKTGEVIYSPDFPILEKLGDERYGLTYDNTSNQLYALYVSAPDKVVM